MVEGYICNCVKMGNLRPFGANATLRSAYSALRRQGYAGLRRLERYEA